MTLRLVIELGKAEIVQKNKTIVHFLEESLPNKHFIIGNASQTNDSKCANQKILQFAITYIKATTRFDRSLISNQWKLHFHCF